MAGPDMTGTDGVTDLVIVSNEENFTFSSTVPAATPAARVRRATESHRRTSWACISSWVSRSRANVSSLPMDLAMRSGSTSLSSTPWARR